MWIASKNGFVSIVQHRENPDQVVVRARIRRDLELLFPQEEILALPEADYAFRVFVSKEQAMEVISKQIAGIDYPNFKNAIAGISSQRDKLEAYHRIWSVMRNHSVTKN